MEKDMTLEENRKREESRVVGKEMTLSRKKKKFIFEMECLLCVRDQN